MPLPTETASPPAAGLSVKAPFTARAASHVKEQRQQEIGVLVMDGDEDVSAGGTVGTA